MSPGAYSIVISYSACLKTTKTAEALSILFGYALRNTGIGILKLAIQPSCLVFCFENISVLH